ncbi:hypothetical protein AJ80_03932 [Polytolypa hystricis UAMH7299]|uniref:rRNA-processing protein EBP2 n=1 Tax=Polytolypa hystricis (strain UAMH7299) TaxID=1447883 RepID=A0A2B7YEX6_POLH7|nr:hypothetical protein AJ80_03932 [Polytolypa hystricis UAMH7299]
MPKKSKLLNALDAHKDRNYELERQKKMQKSAAKRKKARTTEAVTENGEKKEDVVSEITDKIENEKDEESPEDGPAVEKDDEDEWEEEEEDDEEDIPLSELSGEDTQDVIPHQRLTINNSAAIRASLKRISFLNDKTPFLEHNSLTSLEPIDVPDPNDDLTRELAFYKVCVSGVTQARSLFKKEGVPFSRPTDYFAEMVKSDEHMGIVKKKMIEEAAAKKASAEAKKQRELKKFGKQVQVAKLQQRHKEKKETLEKISSLKRKRKNDASGPIEDEDLFDVALDDASKSDPKHKRSRGDKDNNKRSGGGGPVTKRHKKDEKYGFGGKKRFGKSGDAASSGDMSGFSVGRMKGKPKGSGGAGGGGGGGAGKRLGKSRRGAGKRD